MQAGEKVTYSKKEVFTHKGAHTSLHSGLMEIQEQLQEQTKSVAYSLGLLLQLLLTLLVDYLQDPSAQVRPLPILLCRCTCVTNYPAYLPCCLAAQCHLCQKEGWLFHSLASALQWPYCYSLRCYVLFCHNFTETPHLVAVLSALLQAATVSVVHVKPRFALACPS